jgi:hypothetical protein
MDRLHPSAVALQKGFYMNTILFFLFSILETLTIYYLTFVMFSFIARHFWIEALIGSILLTVVSYFMRGHSLGIFDVMLQPLLFILTLTTLFRNRLVYSVILSFAYITYVMIQITIIMGLKITTLDKWVFLYDFGIYVIISLSILSSLLLISIMRKYHLRYSFIPTSRKAKYPINVSNILPLCLIISEILTLGLSYYWYNYSLNWIYFSCSIFMFLVALYIMRLLNKKEYAYD